MTDDAQEALFEGWEPATPIPGEDLSAQQRLTRRQYADVEAGRHPLTGQPVHPEAPKGTDRPKQLREAFTCGGCRFLSDNGWGYLKCQAPGPDGKRIPARQTHGPQTDVRRWWPACPDYQPDAKP